MPQSPPATAAATTAAAGLALLVTAAAMWLVETDAQAAPLQWWLALAAGALIIGVQLTLVMVAACAAALLSLVKLVAGAVPAPVRGEEVSAAAQGADGQLRAAPGVHSPVPSARYGHR